MYPHPATAIIGQTFAESEPTFGSQASDVISWPPTPGREPPIGDPTHSPPRMDRLCLIQSILGEVHPSIVQQPSDRENQPSMHRAERIRSILAEGHHTQVPSNVFSDRTNNKERTSASRLELIQRVLAHQVPQGPQRARQANGDETGGPRPKRINSETVQSHLGQAPLPPANKLASLFLGPQQQNILAAVRRGDNVFFTGSAGVFLPM